MIRVERDNKIYLTKGDNGSVKLIMDRPIYDDDEIVLTVKKNYDTDQLFQLTLTDGQFNFVPDNTKDLDAGNYLYDVQMTTFAGKIYTIVEPSILKIGEQITGEAIVV